MIKNAFFLVAGLLSLMFAAGHIYWEQAHIFSALQEVDPSLLPLLTMGWNLQASTTLLSGVALLLASVGWIKTGVLPLAWFILAINVGRYILLLVTAIPMIALGTYEVSELVAQSVMLFLYLGVIYFGIRRETMLIQR